MNVIFSQVFPYWRTSLLLISLVQRSFLCEVVWSLSFYYFKVCSGDFRGGASIGKEPACLCGRRKRRRFNPWVRKIPWRRKWQPTPVFLPGKPHGQRSLVGYSPQGSKESDTTEQLHFRFHFLPYINPTIFSFWEKCVVSPKFILLNEVKCVI